MHVLPRAARVHVDVIARDVEAVTERALGRTVVDVLLVRVHISLQINNHCGHSSQQNKDHRLSLVADDLAVCGHAPCGACVSFHLISPFSLAISTCFVNTQSTHINRLMLPKNFNEPPLSGLSF
jgi:hypothetical protein